MIAADSNVLIAAHRGEAPRHERALLWLTALTASGKEWGVPVFCLAEFLRVVTHPRVFDPPTPLETALAWLGGFLRSPGLTVLLPSPHFVALFIEQMRTGNARGNLAFDAQIAALCRDWQVPALLTEDRDFKRFPKLRIITLDEPLP